MTDIAKLEKQMEECRRVIKVRDAILRLQNNSDFKTVFDEYYFKDFATNLVLQRGMTEFHHNQVLRDTNLSKLEAIGEVQQFLTQSIAFGNQAESKLESQHELKEKVIMEDA